MPKILFLIPSLESGGAAKQLSLLAAGLPRERWQCRVYALGGLGPFAAPLREAGVAVDGPDGARPTILTSLFGLRRLVHDVDPDLIHAWTAPALRAARLAIGRESATGRPRAVVLSGPLPVGRVGPVDRYLLRRADRVTARGPAEAARYFRLGVSEEHVAVVPLAVEAGRPGETDVRGRLGLPPDARVVVCAGPLEPHKGYADALWAYAMLKYVHRDLHLLVVGTGSDAGRLQHLARVNHPADVHFLGARADARDLLRLAEVVWVPSRAEGGANVALEAMAAGRPVVATRLPGLSDVVVDGQTGCLVAPGDKLALAQRTRALFEDAERRRRLGEAGRARAAACFAVADVCRRFTDLYESVAA